MVAGGDLRVFDMVCVCAGVCIGCVFVEFPSILCFDYFDVTMVYWWWTTVLTLVFQVVGVLVGLECWCVCWF